MYEIVTTVMVANEKIQIMHTVKMIDGKQEMLLVHWIDVTKAGELSRQLATAIDRIIEKRANSLPDKTYEPIAGRSNA